MSKTGSVCYVERAIESATNFKLLPCETRLAMVIEMDNDDRSR